MCPVAVFRTDVIGSRLVPRDSRGPQNVFHVPRSDNLKANLQYWVWRRGLKATLNLWPDIDKIRRCVCMLYAAVAFRTLAFPLYVLEIQTFIKGNEQIIVEVYEKVEGRIFSLVEFITLLKA
ncbi:hypothetical protein AVEN_170029-1 [Araneus ventricosus]|uniref:Uncharacterized protein n=1 Tax=Araneus ventricosus TaxID=182803 RepID=A0A4Y2LGD5_ARAVE|nr:hypothetical protein AVEN_170029-1 [Araneus ventricosus]